MKKRIWELLSYEGAVGRAGRALHLFLVALILLNVVAVIVGSMQVVQERYQQQLDRFEILSVAVFSAEYLLLLWSCTASPKYSHPLFGRLRYATSALAIIDLLAVLPFFLALQTTDLRLLRVLRLMRLARVIKLGRYSASARLIDDVFRSCRGELGVTVVLMILLVIISSSLLFFAEGEAQPDKFPDIPSTMWWAVVTLTTVGYGDVYPVTATGKFCAGVIAILGIGLFALPTAILGSTFVSEVQKQKKPRPCCPHCGRELDRS